MLYICATPIGNLKDITLRALEVLKTADFIACETTSHTRKLMNSYNISSALISYREDNREPQGAFIVEALKNGKNVALVSDAGMPAVSDPGYHLVDLAIRNNLEVSVLPGPSALLSALALSGFSADSFLFLGFLPRKTQKRNEVYGEIASSNHTSAFFEAPHRILKTLGEIQPFLKNRRICLCRELTKKFETVMRDLPENLIVSLSAVSEIKGEFTVVVEGCADRSESEIEEPELEYEIRDSLRKGLSVKETTKRISCICQNIKKSDIYELVLKIKEEMQDK